MSHKKSKVRKIVDKILSTQTSVYFGCKKPRWIRQKTDARAGDTVTVNGIKQRCKDKPYPHYEEGYAVISHKRVYNGTLLCFDGKEWIQIDGGQIMAMQLHHLHTDGPKPLYKKIAVDEYNRLRDENAELREKVATLEEAQRWRKFSEKKPNNKQVVLVSDGEWFETAYYHDDGSIDFGDDIHFSNVTEAPYWMPLPSAPKENDDARKD